MKRLLAAGAAAALGCASLVAPAAAPAAAHGSGSGFVTRRGAQLQFRFAGANNYYLMYKSRTMVDDVFADAAAAKFTVLRTGERSLGPIPTGFIGRGWLDIGNADGTNSVAGKAEGVYFQYWDGSKQAYNDGADGLERLDYVLYRARQAGIKLVIPLTNNWRDFGGMDQYVRWRGGEYHDDCEGVDTLAFTRLPAVDVMSYHLYPDGWGKDPAWETGWITRHVREAAQIGKPVMPGEFGVLRKAVRNPVYQEWTDAFVRAGGTGFPYWILSGIQDDGTLYPDFDGFTEPFRATD